MSEATKTVIRRFKNEGGNGIQVSVCSLMDSHETVIRVTGPDSEMHNLLTGAETYELYLALNEMLMRYWR